MKRPLVTTADDNYLVPLLVMIESAIKNAKLSDFNLFVIHDKEKLSQTNKDKIVKILKDKNCSVNFYTSEKYENFKSEFDSLYANKTNETNKNWNSSVLLHGFIADAIPDSIDEVVFIETDLFFLREADSFFNFPLTLPIAAQLDYGSGTQNHYDMNPYFNAGVLITSLKYWRENNAADVFIDDLKNFKYDEFGIWPQDFLNSFFCNKWHLLGTQINVARECLALEKNIREHSSVLEPQNFTFHNDPILVHFLGSPKPFREEYWDKNLYKWRIQNNYIDLDYKYLEVFNQIKSLLGDM